jgi:hypothetical protein
MAAMSGLIIAVGAVLPWSTVRIASVATTRTGVDSDIGGVLTAVAGIALFFVVVVGAVARAPRAIGLAAVSASGIAALAALIDWVVLAPPPATGGPGAASSTGVGILVTLVGAVAAFVTGIALMRQPGRKSSRRA